MADAPTTPPRTRFWKQTWVRWTGLGVGMLLVAYIAYAGFVRYSNGTEVTLNIEVGTYADGGASHGGQSMFLRCGAGSTQGACDVGSSTFTVHKRDRVTVHVFNLDKGTHTHDIRLTGGAYYLWPSGFENELNGCPDDASQPCATESFTAWATGSYKILCELAGHDDAGMHGTLVVV